MQVCNVDDFTDGFNALDKFTEIVDHFFSLDDLGIAWESGGQQTLVNQWLKTHHDRVI